MDSAGDDRLRDVAQKQMVIEVKGGGIQRIGGHCESVDRSGTAHHIEDPFRQVADEMYAWTATAPPTTSRIRPADGSSTSGYSAVVVTLYSIGHSNHGIDRLKELLAQHDIDVVTDVRSVPYSRRLSHFDLPALRDAVREAGIQYLHMPELGGRPRDRGLYDETGRVAYARLASSESFRHGILRVLGGAEEHRIVLLCSEEDPANCHRWRLVARSLEDAGAQVLHIRGDGTLEDNQAVRVRDEALHPKDYQLQLLGPPEDQWRSTKPVGRSK